MARPGMQRPTNATYPAHHHARSSLVPIQDERIWVTLTGPRTPKRGPSIHHSPGSMALHRRAAVREGKPPLGVAYDKTLTIMPVTTSPIAPAGRRCAACNA